MKEAFLVIRNGYVFFMMLVKYWKLTNLLLCSFFFVSPFSLIVIISVVIVSLSIHSVDNNMQKGI